MSAPELAALELNTPEGLSGAAGHEERQGHWEAAARLYALAFRSAMAGGALEHAVDALRGQARVRLRERRFAEAEELAELSREIAARNDLMQAAARAVNVLGLVYHDQEDLETAEVLYGRALDMALDVGDDELVGLACQNLGILANIRGDAREARVRYLECIGSAVRSGDSNSAMLAYNNLGMATADLREWLEAEIYFTRGIEIGERLSASPVLARIYSNRAEPLIQIGEIERARESLDRAEAAAQGSAFPSTLAEIARYRGVVARVTGDFAAAEGHLRHSLRVAREAGLGMEEAEALRELAQLRLDQGRADAAREAFRQALDLFRTLGAVTDARDVEEQLGAA